MGTENDNVYEEIIQEGENDQTSKTKKTEEESGASETEKTETTKDRVITADDVKKLGISDSYKGKPYDETIAKIIRSMNTGNVQMSQKIADIEKKYSDIEAKLTPKEVKEVKEEVDDKLPPMPDPIDKPDEFAKWLKLQNTLITKEVTKVYDKKIEDLEKKLEKQGETVGSHEEEKNNVILWDRVGEVLQDYYGDEYKDGKNGTVALAMAEYEEYLKDPDNIEEAELVLGLKGKPKALAKLVINYHKAEHPKAAKKTEEPSPKDVKAAHDKKVADLKDKSKKFTDSATSPRKKEDTKEEDEYSQLIKEAELEIAQEEPTD